MTDTIKSERIRRTAEQLASDHFKAGLAALDLEGKVALIKQLKEEVNIELATRETAAAQARELTTGM